MAPMTHTPGDLADLDNHGFYLRADLPALYVSLKPGVEPRAHRALALWCRSAGLHRFDAEAAMHAGGGVVIEARYAEWQLVLDYDLGLDAPPLMSIDWPGADGPLLSGVRAANPAGWASDAALLGRVALFIGPPIDWQSLAVTLTPGDSIMTVQSLMRALAGHPASAGILPVKVRP